MALPVRRVLKTIGASLVVLIGAFALWAWVVSARALARTYDVPAISLMVPTGAEAIARGQHLVMSVGTCTVCHGRDLGGEVFGDMGWAVGRVAGPNLTSGRGGVVGGLRVDDYVRAIRFGVRRDGTSLIAMPSEVFAHMTDDDLGAVIAYLQRLPPVDRDVPASRFGPIGRALLAAGKLSILVAPKTARNVAAPHIEPATTVEYGHYLADIGGCAGCHGQGLSGGRVAGPSTLPLASNLTPAGLGGWRLDDFIRALRTGRRPDGTAIDPFMPWQSFREMTDQELNALWMYLRSVPPRVTGAK